MRPIDLVRRLCPGGRPEYLAAFEAGDGLLAAAGITTPKRLAHFLAQVLHETDGLTIFVESAGYTRKNLSDTWDQGNWRRYFPSKAAMMDMAGHGEQLFNIVYGDRMGNGPPSTGDGFRYRGRGVLQTTGREAYRSYGRRCGVDFEGNPDLVITAEHALKPALAEWVDGKCNAMADRGDIEAITRKINGGVNGYTSRCAWLRRIESALGGAGVDIARRPIVATVGEKPKSTTAAVAGSVVTVGVAAVASVAPSVDWTGVAILAGIAAVAVVVGVVLLVRHHRAVVKAAKEA